MKPILFSTPMVQSILEGRKTQTRRIIKDLPELTESRHTGLDDKGRFIFFGKWRDQISVQYNIKPKYQPGDILYVRETSQCVGGDYEGNDIEDGFWIYRADGEKAQKHLDLYDHLGNGWRPSIFMPKAAARIFLKVTDVRAQRLHDITEADAIAEGVQWKIKFPEDHPELKFWKDYEWTKREKFSAGECFGPKESFRSLWKSINGPESWDENPYVFAYTFERCEKPQ